MTDEGCKYRAECSLYHKSQLKDFISPSISDDYRKDVCNTQKSSKCIVNNLFSQVNFFHYTANFLGKQVEKNVHLTEMVIQLKRRLSESADRIYQLESDVEGAVRAHREDIEERVQSASVGAPVL